MWMSLFALNLYIRENAGELPFPAFFVLPFRLVSAFFLHSEDSPEALGRIKPANLQVKQPPPQELEAHEQPEEARGEGEFLLHAAAL